MEIMLKNLIITFVIISVILILDNFLWYVVGGADLLIRIFNGN